MNFSVWSGITRWGLLSALILMAAGAAGAEVKRVGTDEFEKLWQDKDNILLDVRTPREFAASRIPGAINLDFNAPEFAERVARLDRNKTYLVQCATGRRSAAAGREMRRLGFASLYDLAPGIRGWAKEGKPVEKP